jgi:formiminotetrahydrofolate cyclodeaminase
VLSLTYDLWNEIIYDAVEAHAILFDAMHQTADQLKLSKELVEDLKQNGMKDIGNGHWHFTLQIDLLEDKIEGFTISLLAAENMELFELSIAKAAANHGISLEEIQGFEIEHGLEMDEEIFENIIESFNVTTEITEDEVIFELVVFDSRDLDNNLESDPTWQ